MVLRLILILLAVSACSPVPPAYRPKILDIREIEAKPLKRDCSIESPNGEQFPCVWLFKTDFDRLMRGLLEMDRELRAACLALGNTDKPCRTEGQAWP